MAYDDMGNWIEEEDQSAEAYDTISFNDPSSGYVQPYSDQYITTGIPSQWEQGYGGATSPNSSGYSSAIPAIPSSGSYSSGQSYGYTPSKSSGSVSQSSGSSGRVVASSPVASKAAFVMPTAPTMQSYPTFTASAYESPTAYKSPGFATAPAYKAPTYLQSPVYTPATFLAAPTYTAPVWDQEQVKKNASKYASPYITEMRKAIRDAIVSTASSTSPILRKYQLGGAMEKAGEGMGTIMSDAAKYGLNEYQNQYGILANAAQLNYGANVSNVQQQNTTNQQNAITAFNAATSNVQGKNVWNNQEAMANYNAQLANINSKNSFNQSEALATYNSGLATTTAKNAAANQASVLNYQTQIQGIADKNTVAQQNYLKLYNAALATYQRS